MVDDATLSREAAYIFNYAIGFEPVNGNLSHWRGVVHDSQGQSCELQVKIPPSYPIDPPVLQLSGSTKHPMANDAGELKTRTINRWSGHSHVYVIIKEAQSLLSSAPFSTASTVRSSQANQMLEGQLSMLRQQLVDKKSELQNIQQQSAQQIVSTHNVTDMIHDALIELDNESYALEEAFDDLELKSIEFAKNFVDVRKRYYTIKETQ